MCGRQIWRQWLLMPLLLHCLVLACVGSAGDKRPLYRGCVQGCEQTGCVDGHCFNSCNFPVNVDLEGNILPKKSLDLPYEKFLKEPLYLGWKKWDCISECRYQCMLREEVLRSASSEPPVKYHNKWPFLRIYSLQVKLTDQKSCSGRGYCCEFFPGLKEPASVGFSVLNLLAHFQGFSSFLVLIYYKLPLHPKGPYYEYVGLWTIYGLLSMNSWIWGTVFHSRDMAFTERLDFSAAVALLGYSLILAIIRTGNLRVEAVRVMVAAPIIAFISTHILYLNFYEFDQNLYMIVNLAINVLQLSIWAVWAWLTKHPARYKLWTVVFCAALAMLLEIFDFPPLWGVFDAHAVWHATTLPITYIWWNFIKDDAIIRTDTLVKRSEARSSNKDIKKTQ